MIFCLRGEIDVERKFPRLLRASLSRRSMILLEKESVGTEHVEDLHRLVPVLGTSTARKARRH